MSEAVGTQPVTDPDHHQVVVREPMRGYRIAGKVARASRVVIGEYQAEEAKGPSPAPRPAPQRARRAAAQGEPTLEEIIARAEAAEPPAPAPAVPADDAALEDAEPLWHDPEEDKK